MVDECYDMELYEWTKVGGWGRQELGQAQGVRVRVCGGAYRIWLVQHCRCFRSCHNGALRVRLNH